MEMRKFREAMEDTIEMEQGKPTELTLSVAFQNAMAAVGRNASKVEVIMSRRGPGFRITVEVPTWAQRHLADFVDAEIQAEQDRAERLAAARRLQP